MRIGQKSMGRVWKKVNHRSTKLQAGGEGKRSTKGEKGQKGACLRAAVVAEEPVKKDI